MFDLQNLDLNIIKNSLSFLTPKQILQLLQELPDDQLTSLILEMEITGLTAREFKLNSHFSRLQIERFIELWLNKSLRMLHFTNKEALSSIASGKSVWLMNSRKQIDDSEMFFGMEALKDFLNSDLADRIWKNFDELHPGVSDEIKQLIHGHHDSMMFNTYIFCLCQQSCVALDGTNHMWSKYGKGRIAVEINPKPMGMVSSQLGANSYPVIYKHKNQLNPMMVDIAHRIINTPDVLAGISRNELIGHFWSVVEQIVYGTKKAEYEGECEWRIVYTPQVRGDSVMEYVSTEKTKKDSDAFELPLKDYPEEGVVGLNIKDLVTRVLIRKIKGEDTLKQEIIDLSSNLDLGLDPSVFQEVEIQEAD